MLKNFWIVIVIIFISLSSFSALENEETFSLRRGYIPQPETQETLQTYIGRNGEIFEYFEIDTELLPQKTSSLSREDLEGGVFVYLSEDTEFSKVVNENISQDFASLEDPGETSSLEMRLKRKIEVTEETTAQEPPLKRKKLSEEEIVSLQEALLQPPLDRRTLVEQPTKHPWSMNGRLNITFKSTDPDKKSIVGVGSGITISPSCVLTCGHNIYLDDILSTRYPHLNRWAYNISFSPGIKGAKKKHSAEVKGYSVTPQWVANNDRNEDLAVVHLNKELGKKVGFIPVNPLVGPLEDLKDQNIRVTGYPGELNNLMHTMEGPIKGTNGNKIYYDIDTTPGNSGSCISQPGEDQNPVCIGVHTTGPGRESKWNGGVAITTDKYSQIEKWVKRFEGIE